MTAQDAALVNEIDTCGHSRCISMTETASEITIDFGVHAAGEGRRRVTRMEE